MCVMQLVGLMDAGMIRLNACAVSWPDDYSDDLDPRCIMCGYHPRDLAKVHRLVELDRLGSWCVR